MPTSSRINSSLKRRKRIGFLKKILYGGIFVLFFCSLFVLALTWDKLIIKNISISGNSAIHSSDISAIAEMSLEKRYLGFIRTDNWFLIRRGEIKSEVYDQFPKIESVQIHFHGFNVIEIAILEREPANLFCSGIPTNLGQCYFMDKNGFVFGMAPKFSSDVYPQYFGLIAGDPMRQGYFDKNRFSEISRLFQVLSNMNFSPEYFYAKSLDEYEIGLNGGAKIFLNSSQSFEKSLTNLQALIDNSYVKTDSEFLKKLEYIDLRFGNKVPVKVRLYLIAVSL